MTVTQVLIGESGHEGVVHVAAPGGRDGGDPVTVTQVLIGESGHWGPEGVVHVAAPGGRVDQRWAGCGGLAWRPVPVCHASMYMCNRERERARERGGGRDREKMVLTPSQPRRSY